MILRWLAGRVARYPVEILLAAMALVSLGAAYGIEAPTALSPAGYEVSNSESTQAIDALTADFETGAANVVLLTTTGDGPDSASAIAHGREATTLLRSVEGIDEVVSYWETQSPPLLSTDGQHALITARIVADEATVYERVDEIRELFDEGVGDLEVSVGGSAAANLEIVEESERDLVRAELLVIPLTTIVMLFVFRSVVAALLPLLVSAVAVVGTAAVLRGLSEVTLVSIFALNLTTALGFGMAVDYSLFLISRWREERQVGKTAAEAIDIAIQVAGRSILFSGLTTAATLGALLLFDYPLLRSLAVAGFVVVLLATTGALVVLPAAMVLLGDRVDGLAIRGSRPKQMETGAWYRLAVWVMARPVPVIAVTVGALVLIGLPFLRAEFGLPDDRVLPESAASREVADRVRSSFDAREFGALAAVVTEQGTLDAPDYARSVSAISGISRVETAAGVFVGGLQLADAADPERFLSDRGVWFSIVPKVEPISTEGESIVHQIRSLPSPTPVLVGGESARLVDNKAEIAQKVPFVLLWVAVAIFALLFWSFRSVVIPIKAFVLNLLSLTASFGAVVWVFQDGRFSNVLGYTPTGLTDVQTPILMFCIAFGLSMDYEVFLLSRIKEEFDRHGDTHRSVATGLQRTGGIITAAAILMAIVFASFATGGVTFIQMVGLGLALSILMDAVVVRALLVPAFMAVAGSRNWWSPSLRRHRTNSLLPTSATPEGTTYE